MSTTKLSTSGKRHRTARTFTPTDRAVFDRLLIQMAALKAHQAGGCRIVCTWKILEIPEAIRSQPQPIKIKPSESFYVEALNAFDRPYQITPGRLRRLEDLGRVVTRHNPKFVAGRGIMIRVCARQKKG
jgi:hypothetical protein